MTNYCKILARCPGLIGFDAPAFDGGCGNVVVEPSDAESARAWLKRRFQVSEDLGLSDAGLVFKIASRKPRVANGKRIKVRFDKPEQFELSLE